MELKTGVWTPTVDDGTNLVTLSTGILAYQRVGGFVPMPARIAATYKGA